MAHDRNTPYRFDQLALKIVLDDMKFAPDDPGPGDAVPSFDLPTLSGKRFRSSDLGATGPVLLIFGSSTCPMTDSAAPGLAELHRRYGSAVRFVMVNVREAHPGQSVPQPRSDNEKFGQAVRLRSLHSFGFEIAVDGIDGGLHRALGTKPNSAYLLDRDGVILFRAHWANDTEALAAALEAVTTGRIPDPAQSGGLMKPMIRTLKYIAPVLDRAGKGAWPDMWRVAPPLAAIALGLKLLGVRPRSTDRPQAFF
jgi:thiol-disulfide isomerase/thioredoxin